MDHSISCEEPLNKPFCKPPEPEEQSMFSQKNYMPVITFEMF